MTYNLKTKNTSKKVIWFNNCNKPTKTINKTGVTEKPTVKRDFRGPFDWKKFSWDSYEQAKIWFAKQTVAQTVCSRIKRLSNDYR